MLHTDRLWNGLQNEDLSWTVEKRALYMSNGQEIPDKMAVVRSDTNDYLGIVGNKYSLIQNTECQEFVDDLITQGAKVVKQNSFDGGCRVWWSLQLPGSGFDSIEKYIVIVRVIVNSRDGLGSFRALLTPVRPYCCNMLNMLLRTTNNVISIRHTTNANARVAEVGHILTHATDYYNIFNDQMMFLYDKPATELGQFIEAVLRPSDNKHSRFINARESILANYGNDPARGTQYGMLNAVGEYLDHQRPIRGSSRLASNMLGSSAAMKQHAYNILIDESHLTYVNESLEN